MSGQPQDEQRLRELFRELHDDELVPPFEVLWRRRPEPRPRLVPRRALAAVLAIMALLTVGLVLLSRFELGQPEATESEQLTLASSLSSWQAPLDFLLETPGQEFLNSTPSLHLSLQVGTADIIEKQEITR